MNLNYIPLNDPYILLSWLNMKLRDECKDLEELCLKYEISQQELTNKIKMIGYVYEKSNNQFIAQDSI